MAYSRRKTSYRKKRPTTYRKKRSSFTSRVRRTVRQIAEHKRHLMTWTTQEADYNGHRKYLDEIPQGSGEGERIGRMVTPQSFVARLELRNTETSGAATSYCWTAFLVQDLQTVGDGHAAVSEILSDIGGSTAPFGLVNIANKGRFKICRRWEGVLANSTQAVNIKYLSLYHKFRSPKNIRYNGTAGTDIEANSLMFVVVTGAPPGDDSIYVTGVGRLWYTDV